MMGREVSRQKQDQIPRRNTGELKTDGRDRKVEFGSRSCWREPGWFQRLQLKRAGRAGTVCEYELFRGKQFELRGFLRFCLSEFLFYLLLGQGCFVISNFLPVWLL